ncbi:MAG TPA: glycine cleavage system protein GcvH [Bacteroidales bacterium]|nr:MAG: glycine cleavage system protein H [Bacteroidetes bacterium GWE2_42_24]OFY32763.1 MAG: glycine cleavage system protein H [Bacteroidetes bacterium GWF2_43_11]PKP20387.1 MAG: glycine cleavage system protein H [Bacteroidetes bacterium HGW-Bacteroidetes-22]HAQ66115.1 glycine cleavage system protein GcvH [Bacteroidales bacterium]HBZ65201.1 glycine cleavage system protein GcvH [Bacteroidales bacterium]
MKILDTLKYTPNHEWLQLEGDEALVGVTDFAQSQLGDIVFVEVETVGEILEKGESFGTIEAVKTVEDIYLPVSGEILEFNEALNANPELINKEPYEGGWVVRIKVTNPSEVASLLDAVAYEKHVAESAH